MYQNVILESISSQLRLVLNIENVDALFPGFMLGDFAVLHGSSSIQSLLLSLCVLAQLPYQLGGLETNVLFVDGNVKLIGADKISELKWTISENKSDEKRETEYV